MQHWHGIQRPHFDGFDDWILRQYREMYDVFFEDKHLIPNGHFHELRFSDLENQPIEEMRTLYEALDLPNFRTVESDLCRYVRSIEGYQKNMHPALPSHLKNRIATEWKRCFEEWGY